MHMWYGETPGAWIMEIFLETFFQYFSTSELCNLNYINKTLFMNLTYTLTSQET